jgi:hypothetical protein
MPKQNQTSENERAEPVTLVSVEAAVARAFVDKHLSLPNLTPAEMQRLAQKVYDLLRDDLRRNRERSLAGRF